MLSNILHFKIDEDEKLVKSDGYLHHATIPFVGDESCKNQWKNVELAPPMDPKVEICAGVNGVVDACLGDGGGKNTTEPH